MKGQRAHHTVSTSVFSDHVGLLFELDRSRPVDGRVPLNRVTINASCKGKLLRYLAEVRDITACTIFPDLVGLGRFLRWQFDSLRTMLF